MKNHLVQRLIFGLLYAAVIVFATHPAGSLLLKSIGLDISQYYLYYLLIISLSLLSIKECISIMKFGNGWAKYLVFIMAGAVLYRYSVKYFNHGFSFRINLSEILGLSLVLIAIITLFKFRTELYTENGKLIFTVIYASLTYGFALGIPSFSYSQAFSLEAFFLFVLIWSSDTFAFVFGRLFGKHKIAPKISPKKTWEGFLGSFFSTLLLSYFINKNFPELKGNWIIVGILVTIFGPLGDLVESQLKRNFGVKDSGSLIPGHGGVLDRLDSFIICSPVIYLYFMLDRLS
ncbi:MAG: phosphatidate cytidylyltransferase [Bergeyella sp.]|nr:phosphatidate cytidylyltransferase [Bergeyella sp.]